MAGKRQRRRDGQERLARLRGPRAGEEVELLVDLVTWDVDLSEICRTAEVHTAVSLQQVLLTPTRMNSQVPEGVVEAISRVHTADRGGLVESVLLAATHVGWRDGGRALIEGVAASGVLDAGSTPQVAQALLADRVDLDIPGAWAADSPVLVMSDRPRSSTARGTVSVRRRVSTQLMRWAAARAVTESQDVAAMSRRAQELDKAHGTALMLGMLDVTDLLDDAVTSKIRDLAVVWPNSSVRLAAVKQLVAEGGHGATVGRIAERDTASTVRQWAAKHLRDQEGTLF